MIVYQVNDYDELDAWFPTKREAVAFAKANLKHQDITVERVVTVPVTRASLCLMLEHRHFVKERTEVLKLEGKAPC